MEAGEFKEKSPRGSRVQNKRVQSGIRTFWKILDLLKTSVFFQNVPKLLFHEDGTLWKNWKFSKDPKFPKCSYSALHPFLLHSLTPRSGNLQRGMELRGTDRQRRADKYQKVSPIFSFSTWRKSCGSQGEISLTPKKQSHPSANLDGTSNATDKVRIENFVVPRARSLAIRPPLAPSPFGFCRVLPSSAQAKVRSESSRRVGPGRSCQPGQCPCTCKL